MPKLDKVAGATSEIWQIFIQDSSSTTGAGLTGLVFNSASLTAYYHRDTDTTATVITLVTMTVGTFTSSGFKEIDATNMPGWYQLCPPNAALASGAKSCAVHLKGATNMAPLPIEVQLSAVNPDDAVRYGLTALPNATAEAAGGLYTRGSGAGQIAQSNNGRVDSDAKTIANAAIASATFAAGAIDAAAIATDAIGAAELAAGAATKVRDTILTDATAFAGASIAMIKAKTDNLPEGIKKNTALNNFEFFMADSTDHVTGKTGLAVTGTTSIDGGVFAALTNAVTEVASGIYKVNLAAADINGDVITLKFTAAAADATLITFKTSP